jgi:hypothetical protein
MFDGDFLTRWDPLRPRLRSCHLNLRLGLLHSDMMVVTVIIPTLPHVYGSCNTYSTFSFPSIVGIEGGGNNGPIQPGSYSCNFLH